MEAKVDVRKLQLLNDRITQTIDALNQVRMSVYGLSHSPGIQNPHGQQTLQGNQGFGSVPGFGIGGGFQGGVPGFGQQQSGIPGLQNVGGFNPLQGGIGGLAHSNPDFYELKLNELRASDPTRITQTFPYITSLPWQGMGNLQGTGNW